MRYSTDHKQETHRKILHEAAKIVRAEGPGVGLSKVMGNLGLTNGGFYAHFASKDALIAEAIDVMHDEMYGWFERGSEGARPAEGLSTFIDLYLSSAHRDNPQSGCPTAALHGEIPRLPPAVKARFIKGARRLPNGIALLLRAMGREEPERDAETGFYIMVGALIHARVHGRGQRSNEILESGRSATKRYFGLSAARGTRNPDA